jgi:Ni,Fe-hydrogenase maturation factor
LSVEKRAKKESKKYKILVFGNPMLKEDSVPLKLIPRLAKEFPNIEFKEFDPNDNLEKEGKALNIIDCIQQIRKVTIVTEIDKIETARIYTMHDFDLGYNLKLLKKMGYLDSVRIFGVPMKMKENEAFTQLVKIINATLV